MKIAVTLLIATLGACLTAQARVYDLRPTQSFSFPNPNGSFENPRVAIDGDSIIALLESGTGRSALLYRRGANGVWALSRTLLQDNVASISGSEVAMGPGLAAVKLDDVLHIYERVGGDWVESATAGTPRPAPGLAVSGQRIVAGRRGCNYDADVYEKSLGSGTWRINGRIAGAAGECTDHGVDVDLDGDVALVRNPGDEVREYRRSGTNWPQTASFTRPNSFGSGPVALRGATAVSGGGLTFTRSAGVWNFVDDIRPANYGDGAGFVGEPDFRDGVLHTADSSTHRFDEVDVYLYHESRPGHFEHVAVLNTPAESVAHDVSGNTAVAGSVELAESGFSIDIFTLPNPIVAPAAIANDFDTRDVSGFQQTPGSQFALATSGSNSVYRQSSLAGESHAVLTDSDWSTQQSIEADLTPTAFDGSDRWFGLAVRYVDAANFYYVTLRSSNRIQLKRMANGVFTTLAEAQLPVALNQKYHVKLTANGPNLSASVDGHGLGEFFGANDTTHSHGRAALMTYRTRVDFDNVYVSPTLPFTLTYKDFSDENDFGPRPFTYVGGTWTLAEDEHGNKAGDSQTSTAGDVRVFHGATVDDQAIEATLRLDQWGTSPSGTWFGVLARYVDAGNTYYLSVRSTGHLQIRRQLGGSISVLASVPFTVNPGEFHSYKLSVTGNVLHAYVDGVLLAGATDGSIPRGQYGFGMYRTAATVRGLTATQP